MKRLLMLALPLLPSLAWGGYAMVEARNFKDYGTGEVCIVNPAYNDAFEKIFLANDFDSSRTSIKTAKALLSFFVGDDGVAHGQCYTLPPTGKGKVPTPDQDHIHIFTILEKSDGSPYWNVAVVKGQSEQVITFP